MRKKIGKRTREGAALYASMMAGNDQTSPSLRGMSLDDVRATLGVSKASENLFWDAWEAIGLKADDYLDQRWDAETEAALRTGWSP